MNSQPTPVTSSRDWQEENIAAIHTRLAPIVEQQELARIITSEFQGVFLRRFDTSLELYCYNHENKTLSEIMSRIDLSNPLKLGAEYNQAAILSAVWRTHDPKRIYIAGMGGGRLSMVFHHLFPEVQIDGSDIDPTMITVCEDYFGLHLDHRHEIRVADSREDYASRTGPYDIVILDVFFGEGEHPGHLATVEFLRECKAKMADDGVLVANLVNMDPEYQAKISAICEVFPQCLDWDHAAAHVVFGSNFPPDYAEMSKRIKLLMAPIDSDFPGEEQISRLNPIRTETLTAEALRDCDL